MTSNPAKPALKMDPKLILKTPPPLHPDWLAHEKTFNLLAPQPVITDTKVRQSTYSQKCKDLNTALLSGRDSHLNDGIKIHDTQIEANPDPASGIRHYIPIRSYNPSSIPEGPPPQHAAQAQEQEGRPIIIYYHGGGLYVGDLDSEDLTCRRICKTLQCTVYSCDYRLMPDFTAEDAASDAMRAFQGITSLRKSSRLILVGSSSGGQLAAQVSQDYTKHMIHRGITNRIHGVLLRAPVTCNATDGRIDIPSQFRPYHTSMSSAFHTSLLSGAAVNASNRASVMPLEAESFSGLPRHWIQVCTNDIYYSDGVCYAKALRDAGVKVKLDVVEGWPHTFWLKAPYLERAVQAENGMLEGLTWLLESDVEEEPTKSEVG